MDDCDQFDYAQLDHLLHFVSSSSSLPPPSPRKKDSSVSSQTEGANLVISDINVPNKKPLMGNELDAGGGGNKEKVVMVEKKVTRRDAERQRRREMARLYQRLRLLIPSKYLMGKRSISDHLDEIVDYVKDLLKNIEELETKRATLKNICNSKSHLLTPPPNASMKSDNEDRIRVKTCKDGVEVSVMSGADLKGGLTISKVISALMEEGLHVDSCVSSKVNQRLLHIIQSKVNTKGDIDLARLNFKLMNLSYKL